MTIDTTVASLTVKPGELLSAARELGLAGRWDRALALLDAATADAPEIRSRILLTAAQTALEKDWFTGGDSARARLAVAERELPDGDWDVDFARLRHTYRQLLLVDGAPRFGPAGKDPEALGTLCRRAEALRDRAPDEGRRGWAAMYAGLVADNHFADRAAAHACYTAALDAAESAGDPLLAREALRHLGDHDHDAGEDGLALERWRRATALGAGAGAVPGTLSQQLLLAVLARDTGDPAGAAALAAEVARWADALGAAPLAAQARAFLSGADPTAPPPTP
ncbi:hypothetical protein [Streptomyces sp. NPDC002265]|uniref:hypothetical protein n=1 Tax=Streptomyces sp. NPDC002265 TaxID=3154415 RepID=UPI00331C90FA